MRGVWIAGLVLLAVASAGVAAANQAPQAEAGLDQTAVVNGTVYLDAGGSLDPDGQVVAYRWSIETPGGNTTAPDCVSCEQTRFVPRGAGTYAVVVRVTDDEGESMADTMYVSVASARTPPPSNNTSSTTSVVGSPQAGVGSAGGASTTLDSVAADSNGNRYIVNRNGGDFRFHTRSGETVVIPEERFEQMAGDEGRVDWERAQREFAEEGVTEDDIEDSMEEGNCGGFTCTAVSTASGEPSNAELNTGSDDITAQIAGTIDAVTPGTTTPPSTTPTVDTSEITVDVDPGEYTVDI